MVLQRAYRGLHHVTGKIKDEPQHRRVTCCVYPAATYDADELTRLVIMAHEECVRLEIHPGGPGSIKLIFTQRQREGDFCDRHPTIEQAIEKLREGA